MSSSSRTPLITAAPSHEPSVNASYLDVIVIGASDLPKVGRFSFNDEFYVKLGVDGAIKVSTKAARSHNPVWNELLPVISTQTESHLMFEVWGKRTGRKDKMIGHVVDFVVPMEKEDSQQFCIDIVSEKDSPVGKLKCSVKIKTDEDPTAMARAAINIKKTPAVVQKVADGVEVVKQGIDTVNTALDQLQDVETVVSPLLANLELFARLMEGITKVHPYSQAAWEIISAVFKVYNRQKQMDNSVIELFNSMNALYTRIKNFRRRKGPTNSEVPDVSEDILLRVSQQTLDCSYFIRDYWEPSFTRRLVERLVISADSKISEYKEAFDSMEKQFERGIFENTYIVSTIILDEVKDLHNELELQKLPIADGASLVVSADSTKHCFPGTRTDILSKIIHWANDISADSRSQRVLFLTGQPGSGKSTIAHTVASHFHAIGRLGASFAFSRQNRSRRIDQLFPHIARLIAGLGSAAKKALAEVISRNQELLAITDLRKQFDELLVGALKGLTIAGPIVIVIDAIDEASDGAYAGIEPFRVQELVSVFINAASALPVNIRIIITSRPEDVIIQSINDCPTILHMNMNTISSESAHGDVLLYVQSRLSQPRLAGMDDVVIHRIVHMSQGLFQWAAVVCNEILNAKGLPWRKRYERIVATGGTGLDSLYANVLEDHFDTDAIPGFSSVMSFIFALQEPVPKVALCLLWETSGGDLDVLNAVLGGARSLLNGLDGITKTVQPSHTSLRDFLIEPERSKTFYVATAGQKVQAGLTLACLCVMGDQLHFNMCKLESSYPLNRDVPDLAGRVRRNIHVECLYACQFWAEHFKFIGDVIGVFNDMSFQSALRVLLTEKLLSWLEVLSVLGKMSVALPAMSVLTAHLAKESTGRGINITVPLSLAKDAQEFVQLCAPVASLSAPHIYLSALSFIPRTSAIFEFYSPHFPHLLKVVDADSIKATTGVRNTIHCPGVSKAVISPDGLLIAACSENDIVVFNIHTSEHIGDKLRGHDSKITDMQFSADGTRLASCSEDGTIRLWDMETRKAAGEPLRGHAEGVTSIAWFRDGQRLATSGSKDHTVRAWDTSSGKELWRTEADVFNQPSLVVYSPDSALVAMNGWIGTNIMLLHSDDGRSAGEPLPHRETVCSITFSPNGTQLVSGSCDRIVRVWDVQARELVSELLGHGTSVWAVAFSPSDSDQIASVSSGALVIWNSIGAPEKTSGRILGRTTSRSLAYTPDGASVITTSHDYITLWDTDWYTTEDTPAHHTDMVTCLAFSPTGTQMVSGSRDATARIWGTTTGKTVGNPLVGHSNEVAAVAVSPDGALVVSGSGRTLYLWDMVTSERVGDPLEGNESKIKVVCFSDDGRHILSCTESELLIWDRDTHSLLSDGKSKFPVMLYYAAAFGPDHKILVGGAASDEGSPRVLVWDVTLQEPRFSPWPIEVKATSVAVSPDSSQIVLGDRIGNVSVRNLSGELLQLFERYKGLYVTDVAFLPDGAHIVSLSRTLLITNLDSGQVIGPLVRYSDLPVRSLALTADGTRLALGLDNGHIQIWNISLEPEGLVSGYTGPILFSYNVNHAMPSLDMQSYYPDSDIRDRIRLQENGFVTANVDNEDRLLFWVPVHLRKDLLFFRRHMLLQVGSPVQLDLSRFVYGTEWTKCCSPLSSW